MAGGEVHDRPAQVRAERAPVAQVVRSPDRARERVLNEVFGQCSAADQEEGEPDAVGRVRHVQIRERALAGRLLVRRHARHRCPFIPHMETLQSPLLGSISCVRGLLP